MVFREKFIDPEQIEEIVRIVTQMSKEQGFTAALCGGIAMQIYGSERFTKDVDFVLDQMPGSEKPLRMIKPLSFGGDRLQAPAGGMVDFIVRSDDYEKLYHDALHNAQKAEDGPLVITPEYLAAMKLAAGREKDILDLKWLIGHEIIDLKKTSAIIYRHLGKFGQDRFEDTVDQALWEKQRKHRRGGDPEKE
jgi:hypothetical protein